MNREQCKCSNVETGGHDNDCPVEIDRKIEIGLKIGIANLMEFSDQANLHTFNKVFGEELGKHLSLMFVGCERNIVMFFMKLDDKNKYLLFKRVFKYDNRHGKNPIYIRG